VVALAAVVALFGIAPVTGDASRPVLVSVLEPSTPAADELLPPILEPLTRGYEEPPTPFSAGHRGVDIEVEDGVSELRAPIGGVVDTAVVVGNRFVTIERNATLRVTLSYLSAALVLDGATVTAGEPVARAGTGHPESTGRAHVHLSVRVADVLDPSGWRYVDPMPYLRRYLRRVREPIAHAVADPFV